MKTFCCLFLIAGLFVLSCRTPSEATSTSSQAVVTQTPAKPKSQMTQEEIQAAMQAEVSLEDVIPTHEQDQLRDLAERKANLACKKESLAKIGENNPETMEYLEKELQAVNQKAVSWTSDTLRKQFFERAYQDFFNQCKPE